MRITLFGGLEVHSGAEVIPIAPKPRQVLATLLLNANRVTYVDDLAVELWGRRPPSSHQTTLQTYIYQLRRMIDETGLAARIVTRPNGYMINLAEDTIDVCRFEAHVDEARRRMDTDALAARELLAEAMALCRGPALAGIECGDVLSGFVVRLDELRMEAREMAVEASIRSGRHRELVAELKQLVHIHPYHEAFHAQLVRALALSGRRHEAIAQFREVCSMLRNTLGIDPSPCLEEAFQLALRGEQGAAEDAAPLEFRSRHARHQIQSPRLRSS